MNKDKLYFKEGPRAVLLVHAYTGSIADVRRTARALQKANYTVYSMNLTGHGTGRIEDVLASDYHQWYQDVENAVSFLRSEGYSEVAIFGLSLGGILTLKAVINQLTTIGAGVFNSGVMVDNRKGSNVHQFFLKTARIQKEKAALPQYQIEEEMAIVEKEAIRQQLDLNNLSKEVRSQLDAITIPFYIAQSQQDELIHPESQEQLRDQLINAPVTFESFENSTHVITISKDYLAFQESLINFLDQLNWTA